MVHRLSRIQGFHVGANDGPMGHIDDFIVDEASWQIRYLVIDTSNWMGGKWVAVSPASVTKIDWSNQSVVLNLTRDEIRNSPTLDEANVPSHELTPRFVIL
ncbi:MAG TPA: PRC-barrel domain-containing protein [Vicinamibacterales bacterium]|nr:PRC-barrel domain-containing protein [Vicinamibacterales bacterium]